jgi:peptidoglycan/xylan/chitin deacetylase (PgdA/CDA1 family)
LRACLGWPKRPDWAPDVKLMSALINRAERWVANSVFRREIALNRDAGVVSFSFDDAPQSACEAGRDILEETGCLGTWYIAGGLTDELEQGRRCHSVNHLRQLVQSGHHIGCHTFSHRRCDQMSTFQMRADIDRNAAFFRQAGLDISEMHFSYPLGAYDLAAKRQAAASFASTRLTTGGIQTGVVDLNGLRAQKLYAHSMAEQQLFELTRATASAKGWLIFYTHDIEEEPSVWGCTPALLRFAVRAALEAGCKVLPVNRSIQYWRGAD